MEFKKRLICAHCYRVMAVFYSGRFKDRSNEGRRQFQTGYRCRCQELNDPCPCKSRILPSWKIIAQFGEWLKLHVCLPDAWQEKIKNTLVEQATTALADTELSDVLALIRRKEAEIERIKDMYQMGDVDRGEYQTRLRDVQAVLSRLHQQAQLENIEAQAEVLIKAGNELIDLASDWCDASAQERTEATQMLVESVFYDPLSQQIVEVSIRQKYRAVVVSVSGEMPSGQPDDKSLH